MIATLNGVQSQHRLVLNFLPNAKLGKARRAVWNGREYLVAPMTLIVPGILEGSKGPLLYLPDDIAENHEQWGQDIPLVVRHPQSEDASFLMPFSTITSTLTSVSPVAQQ